MSNKATFIRALCMGLGYAWFPEDAIRDELRDGLLKPLPLAEGRERFGELYLVLADRDYAGRDTRRLADIIRDGVAGHCAAHAPAAPAAALKSRRAKPK